MLQKNSQTPRKPLTVRGFAKETGYSTRQIKKAIELGEIRVISFAGRRLIPPSEIDRVKEFIA